MVWGEVYRHQRTGAAVLQPELCHGGPVYAESPAWEPAYPIRGSGGMAGKANGGGTSVYVFRDSVGSMLKYIEWDGQSFLQGKRRAQSGTYPWPAGQPGSIVEVNEKEFTYLLSKSIVPFKGKKGPHPKPSEAGLDGKGGARE